MLAQRFLARYCAAQGMPLDSKAFSRESIDLLVNYHWPGNIRELESTVSRAALSAPGRSIRASDIEFLHATVPSATPSGDRLPSLAESERAHIVRVLEAVQWNKKEAARVLDISRGTLYEIVEYSLEPGAHRRSTPDPRAGSLTCTELVWLRPGLWPSVVIVQALSAATSALPAQNRR